MIKQLKNTECGQTSIKTEVEYEQIFTNLTRIAGLNLEQVAELSCSCKFFSNKALIQDW